MFPEITSEEKLNAPDGFIHAYDLTKIFISALKKTELTKNMEDNRKNLQHILENLHDPIEGLIKTYYRPFSSYNNENGSAHEALGLNDLRMAQYTLSGGIELIGNKNDE